MAAITVHSVTVLDNPSSFSNPFQFEICFEALRALDGDLEWQCVYVGSAEDESCDQVLDKVFVGPIQEGMSRFVLQAPAPDASLIPAADLMGVTVVLLVCRYKEQEFLRVGYYVNNEYANEELAESPPNPPRVDALVRNILADKPRVTRFPIDWD